MAYVHCLRTQSNLSLPSSENPQALQSDLNDPLPITTTPAPHPHSQIWIHREMKLPYVFVYHDEIN